MKDYSESLILLQKLKRKAQDAADEKQWSVVSEIANEIIDAAFELKTYCEAKR
jgi:hypothetical protein